MNLPTAWTEDTREVYELYTNLRRILLTLTAAGPLMETRTSSSKKIDKNERVSNTESTRVAEQMRMFFNLRKILTAAGVQLEGLTPDERIIEPYIPSEELGFHPGYSRPEPAFDPCKKTPPIRRADPGMIPIAELLQACVPAEPSTRAAGNRSQ